MYLAGRLRLNPDFPATKSGGKIEPEDSSLSKSDESPGGRSQFS